MRIVPLNDIAGSWCSGSTSGDYEEPCVAYLSGSSWELRLYRPSNDVQKTCVRIAVNPSLLPLAWLVPALIQDLTLRRNSLLLPLGKSLARDSFQGLVTALQSQASRSSIVHAIRLLLVIGTIRLRRFRPKFLLSQLPQQVRDNSGIFIGFLLDFALAQRIQLAE